MSVDLVPEWTIGSLCLTSYPFGVDADSTVDIGEPDMVVETITSNLADGDLERVVRHGNRTYVLEVYVEGPSLAEVASSEATLRSELQRTGLELTHDPGDGFSPASVYEVQTAQLTPQRRDDHESHLIRKFTLTLSCGPWAHSVEAVQISALTAPSGAATSVVVDECNSATGWSAAVDNSSATVDTAWSPGAVSVHELLNPAPQTLSLTRTGSVNFSATRYLIAEVGYNASFGPVLIDATGDGVPLRRLSQRDIGGGWYQCIYETSANTVSSLKFSGYFSQPYADLKIRQVRRTDAPPAVTPRQMSQVVEAVGTERAPLTLKVSTASGSGTLGETIIHTCPEDGSGYSPPLRRWRYSGNTVTTEATRFSGAYEQTEPEPFIAMVPNSALPNGDYLLAARLFHTAPGPVSVEVFVGTIVNSEGLGGEPMIVPVTFPAAGWYTFPLVVLSLPLIRSLGPTTQIDIHTPAGDGVTTIDEAWLFRMGEDCALTMTNAQTSNLWLISPDSSSPTPRVWLADIADGSDARHPGAGLQGMGNHVMSPGGTSIFVAAESDYPKLTGHFYPRWHSNAAR